MTKISKTDLLNDWTVQQLIRESDSKALMAMVKLLGGDVTISYEDAIQPIEAGCQCLYMTVVEGGTRYQIVYPGDPDWEKCCPSRPAPEDKAQK